MEGHTISGNDINSGSFLAGGPPSVLHDLLVVIKLANLLLETAFLWKLQVRFGVKVTSGQVQLEIFLTKCSG